MRWIVCGIHLIEGVDDASPHQHRPQAIDKSSRNHAMPLEHVFHKPLASRELGDFRFVRICGSDIVLITILLLSVLLRPRLVDRPRFIKGQ